jgi:hypothetical protein
MRLSRNIFRTLYFSPFWGALPLRHAAARSFLSSIIPHFGEDGLCGCEAIMQNKANPSETNCRRSLVFVRVHLWLI